MKTNRASVQTILFSKWSSVSPLGQAPISMSLNTMCLPPPLIDAASIRGKVASQSVQKRILGKRKMHLFIQQTKKKHASTKLPVRLYKPSFTAVCQSQKLKNGVIAHNKMML